MTTAAHAAQAPPRRNKRPVTKGSVAAHVFLIGATVLWLVPILFGLYTALRPKEETDRLGYVSIAHTLTFDNFTRAWEQSDMSRYFVNSVIITVPAVIVTLALASGVAFAVSRLGIKFNVLLLIIFTAGNLLPQQVIITPLYHLYLTIHVPHVLSDRDCSTTHTSGSSSSTCRSNSVSACSC
jgi:multiple sugar transport system permease protein